MNTKQPFLNRPDILPHLSKLCSIIPFKNFDEKQFANKEDYFLAKANPMMENFINQCYNITGMSIEFVIYSKKQLQEMDILYSKMLIKYFDENINDGEKIIPEF